MHKHTHIHTQKPEKQQKLNNHFERQKKPEHFKQIMAPSTKPSFPEGNFTVYDKWSQKTLYGKSQGIQA